MIDDATIRDYVETELEFDPALNATTIGVAVHNGIVTLTGHVPSFPEKVAAEAVAKRTKGVRAVVDNIEVQLPNLNRHSDDEIAERAANLLAWEVTAPKDDVKVVVEHGWVTLQGSVDWTYLREQAERSVRHLAGVRGVTNLITLRSASHPTPKPEDVTDQIRKALNRNAEVDAEQIFVTVADGKVVLSGKVQAWAERTAAERAAWAVPGVSQVVDNITIG